MTTFTRSCRECGGEILIERRSGPSSEYCCDACQRTAYRRAGERVKQYLQEISGVGQQVEDQIMDRQVEVLR